MSCRVVCPMLVVTALIVSGTSVSADDGSPQGPAEEAAGIRLRTGAITHGVPEGERAAFLSGDRGRFVVGEPISLAYGFVAVERAVDDVRLAGIVVPRPMMAVDPHNGSWFSVIGPDGEELPYRGFYVCWAANKENQDVSLWPGEFVGNSSEVSFSFDFSQPGEYRLQWHYGWDGAGLVSNEIRIEIVPAGTER